MDRFAAGASPATETARIPARRSSRRRNGLMTVGPALAGAAITLLLIFMPIGQAASVHSLTSFSPPYNGKGLVNTGINTLGCGVKGTITTHPKFTTSTGVGVAAAKSKAKSCASPLGYNWVKAGASSGYFTKPFTGLSGVHHVVVRWTVAWTSTLTATLGPKYSGSAYSSSFVVAVLYLLDETNLTYLLPANGWGWFSSTSNGTVSLSSSASISMYLNQTLVSTHTYMITSAIDMTAYAYAGSKGPSTASAALSLSGTGTSTKLTSITLT